MKSWNKTFQLLGLLLASALTTFAQGDAKQFNKDGLIFSYPSSWSFNDNSNPDAQQLTFGRSDSEAQITIFVFRSPLTTPEKTAEAKKILVDKYVASTTKSFADAGAKPESSPATTDIGSVKAEGVKIRASLDGVPGAAEVYWGVIGERLVVLTFLGPDKALKQATPAWDAIRTTLQIEQPKAKPTTTPKP
jgi:hypothetical protein